MAYPTKAEYYAWHALEEQVEALWKSAGEKWLPAALGTREPGGWEDCACCVKWNADGELCPGCPIADAGHHGCDGTPYQLVAARIRVESRRLAMEGKERYSYKDDLYAHALAKKEYVFLVDLALEITQLMWRSGYGNSN